MTDRSVDIYIYPIVLYTYGTFSFHVVEFDLVLMEALSCQL